MKKFLATLTAASLICGTAFAMKPVTIVNQGSFMAGGTIASEDGKTLHGDHAYVFYQIPKKYS